MIKISELTLRFQISGGCLRLQFRKRGKGIRIAGLLLTKQELDRLIVELMIKRKEMDD